MASDKKIAKELIKQLQEKSLNSETLLRLTDGPELTPEYRIGELKKYIKGEPSPWGKTEVEAEKAFRERETKKK